MKELEDVYEMVVKATIDASGMAFERIAVSREERCVTARVVIVSTLLGMGMTDGDIVRLSGMSQQRVNALKNSARYRMKGLCAKVMEREVRKRVKEMGFC